MDPLRQRQLVPPFFPSQPMTLRALISLTMFFVLVSAGVSRAADLNSVPNVVPDFEKDVLPILQSHCVRCHGPQKQESRIRLDTLSTDLINNRAAAENWHEVLNVLNAGEMPPEDEKQLSSDQRATLTKWVSSAIDAAIEAQSKTSGRVVLRRLTRADYQNTMTELLDFEMDYTRDLPPDAVSADGFKNNGLSLRMSAIHLEYYLATARRALDRVIVSGDAPQVFRHEFKEGNVNEWLGNAERFNRLGRQQEFLAKIPTDYPEAGHFLLRVKFNADIKNDTGFPLLEAAVGYRPDTEILFGEFDLVEVTKSGEQTLEFRGRIEDFPLPVRGQGKYPGLVVRLRNRYDDGSPLPKSKDDKARGKIYPEESHLASLTIQSLEFQAPYFEQWPPPRHRHILFDSPLRENDEAAYVTEVLRKFMRRTYRRPVEDDEVKFMLDFYQSIRDEFPTFEEAIRETLAMVLIRPDFLYLLEPAGDEKRTVGEWELASRLSYFLWSTMPDQRLAELAGQGKLREPKTLANEVERMLKDPRSQRFVDQFTEQWLHLNVLDSVAIDKEYYPGFDEKLKREMRAETQQYFAQLLRTNQNALKLLDSDFTMMNEPLAKHYGVEGVYGLNFQRVALKPEQHRGGLLGQASILLSNSTGADSHAVRRAVWIRDRLLNDPPAPPPADVPSLAEANPEFHKLSIREQLEIHRKKEACASCHRNIDPWGIALENFDAVGLWREDVRRKVGNKFELLPVNAKDSLPDGKELSGVDQLKQYLSSERQDGFAKSLVSRLLTYSLGRRLELSDQRAVDDITNKWKSQGFRLRDLVQNVVASEPFQVK
ncbi:MAG: hypothetical protein ACI9G1_006104 [Pirellulaceae bacterium]|jgi:hypothetical protein